MYCEKCLHKAPVAVVPFIIRWGVAASSDKLNRNGRCISCIHKGATLTRPSWAGTHIGFAPFPDNYGQCGQSNTSPQNATTPTNMTSGTIEVRGASSGTEGS